MITNEEQLVNFGGSLNTMKSFIGEENGATETGLEALVMEKGMRRRSKSVYAAMKLA